jgi:hypothetical protein
MKRFVRALAVTLGLAVLGTVISIVPQKDAKGAGSAPVSVVNTPNVNVANTAANPVPVSGLVAVGNERTLTGGGFVPVPLDVNVTNGTLPVSGSVSISGTPTVQLSSAANLSVSGPVQVSNPTQTVSTPFGNVTQPVPLFVRDGGALTPYRRNCSGTLVGFPSSVSCDLGAVPNNVELVIEQVSGHFTNSNVGRTTPSVFQVALTDGTQSYDFNVFQIGADLGVSQQVRIYIDGGADVSVNIKLPPLSFAPAGFNQYSFAISGFTVNLQ